MHRIDVDFQEDLKAGFGDLGDGDVMQPSCEARGMARRKHISHAAGGLDRRFRLRGIDQNVDVEHRPQLGSRIDAMRQSSALEQDRAHARCFEGGEQTIDRSFAYSCKPAMAAGECKERPSRIGGDCVGFQLQQGGDDRFDQQREPVIIGLGDELRPKRRFGVEVGWIE